MKSRLLLSSIGILAVGSLATLFVTSNQTSTYEPRTSNDGAETRNEWEAAAKAYQMFRANPETGEVSPADVARALKAIKNKSKRDGDPLGLQFRFMGPDNVGGRTRAMLVPSNDSTKVYAGSVSGGLFVSTNEGATWEPHPDFLNDDSLSSIIASIEQAPNGKIWVGTGSSFDRSANATGIQWPGRGIAIGDADGQNFKYLSTTAPIAQNTTNGQWSAVNRIRFDRNTGRAYACTHRGLWYTEDEGETWVNPIEEQPGLATQIAHDIKISGSGSVVVVMGGRIMHSPNGNSGTFTDVTSDNGFVNFPYNRVALAMGNPDLGQDNVLMAVTVAGGSGNMEGIYKSIDGGLTWSKVLNPIPDYFTPLGGQGVYNLAIEVFPTDADKFVVGGLELWKFDGGLSRLTGEGFSSFSPFYVHADKHFFYWNPYNSSELYVCSDGGMSKSVDGGVTFQVVNKGYGTTQYYGIATSNTGVVIGGTQDNGTHAILGDNPFDPLFGLDVFGNDGFDCEVSQITPQLFVSSQFSLVVRLDASNFDGQSELPRKEISVPYSPGNFSPTGNGPFRTVVKLWESADDPTSQDSVLFANDSVSVTVEVGNAVKRLFQGDVSPFQAAATPQVGSFKIYTGNLKQLEDDGTGNLVGNGTGSVVYNDDGSMTYDFTLDTPPGLNLSVITRFTTDYEANDVLDLVSATNGLPFQHVIASDLRPGDQILVRDPVQSLILMSVTGGFAIGRDALKISAAEIDWQEFSGLGTVTCAEFSKDGNVLFVGTAGGGVTRFVGLNNLYDADDVDGVQRQQVATGSGSVTGISVGYDDPNLVVVTRGGYGRNTGYVSYSSNGLSANPTFIDKQGDLPPMPVYDAEIDVNDPGIVLLGTEFGVWATRDISQNNVEWTDENIPNDGWTYVPVYDVRQQKLGFGEATNFYNYYLGTHGRGIWESSTLAPVGIDQPEHVVFDDDFDINFSVYPNPIVGSGTISFELKEAGQGRLRIFSLNGQLVKDFGMRPYSEGVNTMDIRAGELKSGTYLVSFEGLEEAEVTKFVVLN